MVLIDFLNLDRIPTDALQLVGHILTAYQGEMVGVLRGGLLRIVLPADLVADFLMTVSRDVWPVELENVA